MEILSQKVLNSIPVNKKPVNYLMNILNIGRRSAARKAMGATPFTFEEVVELSLKLNFSIDEITKKSVGNGESLSDLQQKNLSAADKHFFISHMNYFDMIESLSKAKEVEIICSLNRIYSFFIVNFDKLFKFYYYLWTNQCDGISSNLSFSEIELPSFIDLIRRKSKSTIATVNNITFILDQYIFMRLIRELQYHYNLKLISHEELTEIKNDIVNFLDLIEEQMQTGTNKDGYARYFYLSPLDVERSSMYGTFDGKIISRHDLRFNIPVNTEQNDLTKVHKNKINSLKRSSILISQSNEIVQASFLNQQREYIKMITQDLIFYYG